MASTDPNLVTRVVNIVSDTQKLIEQQMLLLRREIEEEVRKGRNAAISMAVGAGMTAVAGIVLVLMAVHALNAYTVLPLWGCYGLAGGFLAVVGILLVYFGGRKATTVSLLPPPQTRQAIRESLAWLKSPESMVLNEKEVGQGLEEIHAQMAQIRAGLTENLEALQDRLREKIEPAQAGVEKTMEAVRKKLHAPVAAVRTKIGGKFEIEQALWLTLGVSALVGYGLVYLIRAKRADSVLTSGQADTSQVAQSALPTEATGVPSRFDKELDLLQRVVVSVVMSLLRDWLMETLPNLAPEIEELMNSAIRELGSQPIAGSLLGKSK